MKGPMPIGPPLPHVKICLTIQTSTQFIYINRGLMKTGLTYFPVHGMNMKVNFNIAALPEFP
jgi:hypothetical protein